MTTPQHNTTDHLPSGQHFSKEQLHRLQAQVGTMPEDERKALSAAVEEYTTVHRDALAGDIERETALRALQHTLAQQELSTRTQGERMGAHVGAATGKAIESGMAQMTQWGAQAGEMMATTAERAKALGYKQWLALTHPDRTVATKVLQGFGILALGYGLYRAAQWIKGKPDSSFWGKLLRFTGVSALAGLAINYFGNDAQARTAAPTAPSASPPPALTPAPTPVPTAPPRAASAPSVAPVTKDRLVDAVADGTDLLNAPPCTITLDGKTHTVAIQTNGFYLDGNRYVFIAEKAAFGYDKELSIKRALRQGRSLHLTMGALGKEGSTSADDAQLALLIRSLLQGTAFRQELPKEHPTDKPQFIRLERA